ncbi:MAG: hypothetical protein HY744_06195 [Deltaproteobacteria bacterium]|nr:hypothetical protein [Deltaproteobacteria bacterium]
MSSLGGQGPELRCALAGLAAWTMTVGPSAFSLRAGSGARAAAALALGAAVAGPLAGRRHAAVARHLGLSAFAGLAALSWVLCSLAGLRVPGDRFQAILGAVAWGAFALSWPHPWSVSERHMLMPAGSAAGPAPRRSVASYAIAVPAAAGLVAAACLGLAWRIREPSRAVLAQTVAVAAAVGLLAAAGDVAVRTPGPREDVRQPRTRAGLGQQVASSLLWALVLAALVAFLLLTR